MNVRSLTLLGIAALLPAQERPEASADAAGFRETVAPFLKSYCVKCHGTRKPKGDVTLKDIDCDLVAGRSATTELWSKVLEQLSLRDMPPENKKQPSERERQAVVDWITGELDKIGAAPDPARLLQPRFGNRVDHEALFSGEHEGPAYSKPRLWRISPHVYDQFARDLGLYKKVSQPLSAVAGKDFKDFSTLYTDEAAIGSLLRNSKKMARVLLRGRNEKRPRPRYREFAAVLDANAKSPSDELVAKAVARAFDAMLQRPPTEEETQRLVAFTQKNISTAGVELGMESMLRAIVLSTEFLFRMELGMGAKTEDGRRMLGSRELAFAIAYAITDRPPGKELLRAVAKGGLATRADVEREVRRLLAIADDRKYWHYPMYHRWGDSKPHHPRLMRFFREFFGYGDARAVFKDRERNHVHSPKYLVRDADILVLHALEKDEHVFERLLAGEEFFVTYFSPEHARHVFERNERNRKKRHLSALERYAKEQKDGPGVDKRGRKRKPMKDPGPFVARSFDQLEADGKLPVPDGYARGYYTAYNLPRKDWGWRIDQPFKIRHRRGMLTHPAWLVAHSANFEIDPVRRGKWVRERLLADSVPDLPIGVDAKVEEDPHKTLRERFAKVHATECWRCHKKMNPLGMAFENYDDFGRYRARFYFDEKGELVDPVHQTIAELDAKVAQGELTARPVDASGELRGTRDPKLDGKVDGALDLVQRLAKSTRARQSFVRHAFRFFMGRNETLRDSPTLMAMDRAYVDNRGSFNALLVALLTSDSFLYRKD